MRTTRRRVALLTAAHLVVLVGTVMGPSAADSPAWASDSVVISGAGLRVEGGGWGHGRGLSQFGAQGAASQGVDHRDILGFYYPQARLESRARGQVRVKLTALTASVVVQAAPGLVITDTGSGRTTSGGDLGSRVRIVGDGTGMRLQRDAGSGWQDVSSSSWPVRTVSSALDVSGPATLWVGQPDGSDREYRGSLQVSGSQSGLETVNRLEFEQYLYGVVPRESPSWFAPQALRAQAVAARSYGWSNCSGGSAAYDILDTTACQVYGGKALRNGGKVTPLETAQATAAVDATRDVVLVAGGQVVRAEFSSSNGGRTAGATGAGPRDDPYDGVDSRNGNYRWRVNVTTQAIRDAWPAVGMPRRVDVIGRDGGGAFGGRVMRIRFTGDAGAVEVSGEQARASLGLKSSLFILEGAPPAPPPADVAIIGSGADTSLEIARTGAGRLLAFSSIQTALGASDRSTWRFFLLGAGGAEAPDLVTVNTSGTASGRLEVHVLSGASGYRTFTLHAATVLPQGLDLSQWEFGVGSFNGSGRPDLFAIRTRGGASGVTEVHVLSAASGYQQFVAHAATSLGELPPGAGVVLVGDPAGRGDVTVVLQAAGTGSGQTEVHRLTAISGWRVFDIHAATALHTAPSGQFDFGLGDWDGDRALDLYAVKLRATSSGMAELHVLSAGSGFRTWLTHNDTGLPAAAGAVGVVRPN